MSESRSTTAWTKWVASAERYDYTVFGVSCALVAYISQHLPAVRIGVNAATLEVCSLLFLTVSALAGMFRSRAHTAVLNGQSKQYAAEDSSGKLKGELLKGAREILDESTGDVLSRTRAHSEQTRREETAIQTREGVKRWSKIAVAWYLLRDYALIVGGVLFVAAKVWAAVDVGSRSMHTEPQGIFRFVAVY